MNNDATQKFNDSVTKIFIILTILSVSQILKEISQYEQNRQSLVEKYYAVLK